MFVWIRNHHEILSLATDLAMLAVWGTYLHVFLLRFRRQTRAKIVISWGAGNGLDSACFLSNMSSDPIYVEAIIVCLETGQGCWCSHVTDIRRRDEDSPGQEARVSVRQGPLSPGACIRVGTFRELVEKIPEGDSEARLPDLNWPKEPFEIEVEVVADYAAEDLLIGAARRFHVLRRDGEVLLVPERALTRQIRSDRERRRYQEQLRGAAIGYGRGF